MKIKMSMDGWYPVYFIDDSWGDKEIEWPINLDIKLYEAAYEEFRNWQDILGDLYEKGTKCVS